MPETENRGVEPKVDVQTDNAWIRRVGEYWREFAVVLVLLLGGAAVYAYAEQVQREAEQKAWAAFFLAEYETLVKHDGKLAERMQQAGQAHADTQAVFYAQFMELIALAEKGAYEEAEAAARRFVKARPEHFLNPQVQLILGRVQMIRGDYAAAETTLAGIRGADHLEPEIRLAQAQCALRRAEQVQGQNPEQYKQALEGAREAFLKADAREEKEWPRRVTELSAFGLMLVQDRLRPGVASSGTAPVPVPEDGAKAPVPEAETPAPAAPAEGDAPAKAPAHVPEAPRTDTP